MSDDYEPNVVQEDLRAIMTALGIGLHARPYSPHEVVQREVLPAIDLLRRRADAEEAK